MGLLDKLLGRSKQAEGDLTGSDSSQPEGAHPKAEAAANLSAARPEAAVEEAAEPHTEPEAGA
jgi:uncharacterized protein YjbJ (UPF0337 family)